MFFSAMPLAFMYASHAAITCLYLVPPGASSGEAAERGEGVSQRWEKKMT